MFNLFNKKAISQEELLLLVTLSNSLSKEDAVSKEALEDYIEDFQKNFEKFLRNQSEISLTLSEMRDAMEIEEQKEKPNLEVVALVHLLVETADMVEAFYKYAVQSDNLALINQAELMWKSMLKKYAIAGLSRIPDEQTEVDVQLNRAVAVDEGLQEGVIANTLRSGYVYKGGLVRKSEVTIGSRKEF